MKKACITLIAICCSVVAMAQDAAETTVIPDYAYCQIVGYSRLLSHKVTVAIDYGQFRSLFSDNRIVDKETGSVKKFNSMVDALNYMGEKGWEFVQAYTVTMSNQNVYHFMLKRKLTSEDKKNYIPVTKRDMEKLEDGE